jgi:hypothetical protein
MGTQSVEVAHCLALTPNDPSRYSRGREHRAGGSFASSQVRYDASSNTGRI